MTTDIQNALDAAIYTRLTGGTALMAITATWYQEIAPTDATMPYGVYRFVSDSPDDVVGTQGDVLDYDFVVVDNSRSADRSGSARAEVHALFHDLPLTVSGFSNIGVQRTAVFRLLGDDRIWETGETIRFRLDRT